MDFFSQPLYWAPALAVLLVLLVWLSAQLVFWGNRSRIKAFAPLIGGTVVNHWGRASISGMWRGKQVEIAYGSFANPHQLKITIRQMFPLCLGVCFKNGGTTPWPAHLKKKITINLPDFEKKYTLRGDDSASVRAFLNEKKQKIIDSLMFDSLRFDREGLIYLDFLNSEQDGKPEKAQALLARLGELTF